MSINLLFNKIFNCFCTAARSWQIGTLRVPQKTWMSSRPEKFSRPLRWTLYIQVKINPIKLNLLDLWTTTHIICRYVVNISKQIYEVNLPSHILKKGVSINEWILFNDKYFNYLIITMYYFDKLLTSKIKLNQSRWNSISCC